MTDQLAARQRPSVDFAASNHQDLDGMGAPDDDQVSRDRELLQRFRDRFRADIASGVVGPLQDYLRGQVEIEEFIAADFVAWKRDRVVPTIGSSTGASAERIIGHYRLKNEIGRGGQAIVYRAEDTRLERGRDVALKVMARGSTSCQSIQDRFEREGRIIARLDHPSLCPLLEVGVERFPFIAMRLIDGETLAIRIRRTREQRFTEKTLVRSEEDSTEPAVVGQPRSGISKNKENHSSSPRSDRADVAIVLETIERVARALHIAHEAGIVHRDIKPSNIMIARDGTPVVLDFGLAQSTDDDPLTMTGDLLGTPAYMAPEQITAKRIRVDRRADVFSLGVTLYEWLTLRRPFEGATREAIYQAISYKDPTSIRSIEPSLPDDLRVVVERALEKDRDKRFATAADFAEELRRVRMFEPIRSRPVSAFGRHARWVRRRPAWAVSLYGISLALMLAAAIFGWKNGELRELNRELERASDDAVAQARRARENERRATELAEEAQGHLDEIRRLADVRLVAEARAALEQLCTAPLGPETMGRIEAWESAYGPLLGRIVDHHRTLARLTPADAASSEVDDYRKWHRQVVASLVGDLSSLADAKKGVRAEFDRRRKRWADMQEVTSTGLLAQSRWSKCRDRTKANPRYGGLDLAPAMGLLPLGADPVSGLEEFLHWPTLAWPGQIPERDAKGALPPVDASSGIILVLVPGGRFHMGAVKPGSPGAEGGNVDPEAGEDESPVREVELAPFFISKYEMTQAQWLRIAGFNPSGYGRLQEPVVNMTKDDALLWLASVELGLPTEAQWEYACRAGTTTVFWFGDQPIGLEKHGNVADTSAKRVFGKKMSVEPWDDGYATLAPVDAQSANPWGLHGLIGNAHEICRDDFGSYRDAVDPGTGKRRVSSPPKDRLEFIARGGNYWMKVDSARSAARALYNSPTTQIGLRPMRSLR